MKYLTAKQAIGKLKQGRVTDISEAYFSQLVRDGHIPNHTLPGKKRKLYVYDEVKQALADIQDPTRDAQREANAERRQQKYRQQLEEEKVALSERYNRAMDLVDVTIDQLKEKTGFSDIVLKQLEYDLMEASMNNLNLSDIVKKQKELMLILPLEDTQIELIRLEVLKITIEAMTTVEEFNQLIEDFYTDEDIAEIESQAEG